MQTADRPGLPPAAEYLQGGDTWGSVHAGPILARPVAYFSAEFGLHESLPIYSGGLGVLAGDHLKSASDLGVPLVGVGLLYDQGYFRQMLDENGWQQDLYSRTRLSSCRSSRCSAPTASRCDVASRRTRARVCPRVWRVEVGRTTLLLLDSRDDAKTPRGPALTARLYGGDARVRIRQELLLGVGGVRALGAWASSPRCSTSTRGTRAFALLEVSASWWRARGSRFGEAVRDVAAMTVFTTHTPVAAGHDRFPAGLVEEHLGKLREAQHASRTRTSWAWAASYPGDPNEPFCMTVLALKLSRHANGVSALHGRVSRRMWHPLYPGNDRGGGADRPHHQRRPRPELAGAADALALRPPPGAATGPTGSRTPRPGTGSTRSTTPSSGRRSRSSRRG